MPAPSRAGYRRHGSHRHLIRSPFGGRAVHYWRNLGPGLVTGASDNDPSGIGTYSIAGASTGYRLLWMAPFTLPLLVAVQSMAARIGAYKEEGLGQVIEERFGRKVLVGSVAVLLFVNIVTIAADLGGVAAGLHLLVPVPVGVVIPVIGAGLLAVEIFWSYRRFASVVKWLTLVLFLYIISGFVAGPDWGQVLRDTFLPHVTMSRDFLSSAVAVLGTTISPYMFFWICSQEVEEEEEEGPDPEDDPRSASLAERRRRTDVVTGMAYANLVFYFIILSSAATLGAHGIKVQTAEQAARALGPVVGRFDTVLFAVGMVGAGLIAIPVLAGAVAFPLAELFNWREGLNKSLRSAPGFYSALSAAVVMGVALNFFGVNPFKALLYAAVLQGLLAPVLLVLLTLVASDRTVMGSHRNGWFDTTFGFLAAGVMAAAAVALIVVTFVG
ncbi:MAG: divalent metal cation transporter [Actinobacteria bacterium]|nr:MAG: divalent metal cation transporter [Actinomycetota bacterium]